MHEKEARRLCSKSPLEDKKSTFSTAALALQAFDYEYNVTEYTAALQQVRANATIQDQAMNWAIKVKQHTGKDTQLVRG